MQNAQMVTVFFFSSAATAKKKRTIDKLCGDTEQTMQTDTHTTPSQSTSEWSAQNKLINESRS